MAEKGSRYGSAPVEEIPEGTPREGRSLSFPFEKTEEKRVRASRAAINYVKTVSARQQSLAARWAVLGGA